jgi:hypothetical protein
MAVLSFTYGSPRFVVIGGSNIGDFGEAGLRRGGVLGIGVLCFSASVEPAASCVDLCLV